MSELSEAWEDNAAAWIAWARRPGHDSYWQFHRDLFLEIVPAPSGRTLDLGCGEGRLARDLTLVGHDLVGVDSSPTMLAAAREAAPEMELHLADAADLPFADATFGLVVAFMSLHDIDDLRSAVRETARVLEPGGRLCLAIVHPFTAVGHFTSRDSDSPFVVEGSYLDESLTDETFERDGLAMRFVSRNRPLQTYVAALSENGLLCELLRETAEDDPRWSRVPRFLHLRAVKPG